MEELQLSDTQLDQVREMLPHAQQTLHGFLNHTQPLQIMEDVQEEDGEIHLEQLLAKLKSLRASS